MSEEQKPIQNNVSINPHQSGPWSALRTSALKKLLRSHNVSPIPGKREDMIRLLESLQVTVSELQTVRLNRRTEFLPNFLDDTLSQSLKDISNPDIFNLIKGYAAGVSKQNVRTLESPARGVACMLAVSDQHLAVIPGDRGIRFQNTILVFDILSGKVIRQDTAPASTFFVSLFRAMPPSTTFFAVTSNSQCLEFHPTNGLLGRRLWPVGRSFYRIGGIRAITALPCDIFAVSVTFRVDFWKDLRPPPSFFPESHSDSVPDPSSVSIFSLDLSGCHASTQHRLPSGELLVVAQFPSCARVYVVGSTAKRTWNKGSISILKKFKLPLAACDITSLTALTDELFAMKAQSAGDINIVHIPTASIVRHIRCLPESGSSPSLQHHIAFLPSSFLVSLWTTKAAPLLSIWDAERTECMQRLQLPASKLNDVETLLAVFDNCSLVICFGGQLTVWS